MSRFIAVFVLMCVLGLSHAIVATAEDAPDSSPIDSSVQNEGIEPNSAEELVDVVDLDVVAGEDEPSEAMDANEEEEEEVVYDADPPDEQPEYLETLSELEFSEHLQHHERAIRNAIELLLTEERGVLTSDIIKLQKVIMHREMHYLERDADKEKFGKLRNEMKRAIIVAENTVRHHAATQHRHRETRSEAAVIVDQYFALNGASKGLIANRHMLETLVDFNNVHADYNSVEKDDHLRDLLNEIKIMETNMVSGQDDKVAFKEFVTMYVKKAEEERPKEDMLNIRIRKPGEEWKELLQWEKESKHDREYRIRERAAEMGLPGGKSIDELIALGATDPKEDQAHDEL